MFVVRIKFQIKQKKNCNKNKHFFANRLNPSNIYFLKENGLFSKCLPAEAQSVGK